MENNWQSANYLFPHGCIVVMVKAPCLGTVKTRMQPALSLEQSLALHRDLASDIIQHLQDWQLAPVILQEVVPIVYCRAKEVRHGTLLIFQPQEIWSLTLFRMITWEVWQVMKPTMTLLFGK